MKHNLKNRPRCVQSNIGDIRRWFEGFKKELQQLNSFSEIIKEIQPKNLYISVEKKVYIAIDEILGESPQ